MQQRLGTTLSVLIAAFAVIPYGVMRPQGIGAALTNTQTDSGQGQTIRFLRNPAPVPPFAARDLDGRTISPGAWRGKVILVNFWATWCLPCRVEIPELIALQAKYRDQLLIIGVSEDAGSLEAVKRFAVDHKINYPIVQSSTQLRKSFPGVFGLPTTFVLDRETRIVQKHIGMLKAAIVEAEIRALAGLPVNAVIERVEDSGQVRLENAAQATDIPGVDLRHVPTRQKATVLQELNTERCTCGCGLTVAQCRINDPSCEFCGWRRSSQSVSGPGEDGPHDGCPGCPPHRTRRSGGDSDVGAR